MAEASLSHICLAGQNICASRNGNNSNSRQDSINNHKQQHSAYSKSPNRTNLLISATFGWPPKRKLGHGCHKVLTIKMLACRSIPDDGVGFRVAVVGLWHRLECDGNCQGHAQAPSYIASVAWALRSSAARGNVASCKCHKAPKQPQTQRQPQPDQYQGHSIKTSSQCARAK